MKEKMRNIIESFKKEEQILCYAKNEGEITLYAVDCDGYDTTGALQLQIKNDNIRLVRCSHVDRETNKWVEIDSIELVEK